MFAAVGTAQPAKASQKNYPETFVERCLGKSRILDTKYSCKVQTDDGVSRLEFTLTRGEQMHVLAAGQFGNTDKNLPVVKITHLQPQFTDLGVMGEAVRFEAHGPNAKVSAVMTVQCAQTDFAAVGMARIVGNEQPNQIIAACDIL